MKKVSSMNKDSAKKINKKVTNSTISKPSTSNTTYSNSHNHGTHKNSMNNHNGPTTSFEHVSNPPFKRTRYLTRNYSSVAPQLEDIQPVNSQSSSNLDRRLTRSMIQNLSMNDDDIGNILFPYPTVPKYKIVVDSEWRRFHSYSIDPLQAEDGHRFYNPSNRSEYITLIRVRVPKIFGITEFLASRLTITFYNIPAIKNFSNSGHSVDHIIGTVVHSQSTSLPSVNNEVGPIEVVLRVDKTSTVYIVVVNNYECIQMHKNVHESLEYPHKPSSLSSLPDLYLYFKDYLITLKATILAEHNNRNVKHLLNIMKLDYIRIDQFYYPHPSSNYIRPPIKVDRSQNGKINYKIFI